MTEDDWNYLVEMNDAIEKAREEMMPISMRYGTMAVFTAAATLMLQAEGREEMVERIEMLYEALTKAEKRH
jgi:hypothetical protein